MEISNIQIYVTFNTEYYTIFATAHIKTSHYCASITTTTHFIDDMNETAQKVENDLHKIVSDEYDSFATSRDKHTSLQVAIQGAKYKHLSEDCFWERYNRIFK